MRMKEAIGVRSLAALARHLGIDPSAINAAIRQRRLPETWLYKIANESDRSVDWLLTGRDESQLWRALATALRQVRDLEKVRDNPTAWATQRGVLEALVSQIEKEVQQLEEGMVVAESAGSYEAPRAFARLLTEGVTQLTPDERSAVVSFLDALRSGDEQIRTHLLNQMKVVERALTTRRSRAKNTETA